MTGAARRWRSGGFDAGAAAAEFALVSPLLILLIVGLIEFGRLFWLQNTMQFVAEEGGRFAAVRTTATMQQVTDFARSRIFGFDPATVTITATTEMNGAIQFVTVTTTYDFRFIVTLIPGGPMVLTGRSRLPRVPA
ncbi:MAG: TadE/TadG family type IV pilus assembly protein [Pseudomonadota bacterium]